MGMSVVDSNATGLDDPQSTDEHFTLDQADGAVHSCSNRSAGIPAPASPYATLSSDELEAQITELIG